MKLIIESFEENTVVYNSIGEIEFPITDIKLINDLNKLNSVQSFDELGLLISREWSPEGKIICEKILSKKINFPFFEQIEQYAGKSGLYFYELDPIDNFNHYIEIGVEDLLKNQDLFNYVTDALPLLLNRTSWEGDLRNGLYICPTPGLEDVPILIVKQDNNGTTFLISSERLGWLEPENVIYMGEKIRYG